MRVFVALAVHNDKRMRRVTLSCVASPALTYFSTLSHKRRDFRKIATEHKMCVLMLSTPFV